MPALSISISKAEIEKLSYERYAYPHPMIQKRIFSVYLKAVSTFSIQQIGFITGRHPNTISHWIAVYKWQGYEGLLCNHYGTNQSELQEHSACILSCLSKQPPRSAAEAAGRILEMTGVERSQQQIRTFMKGHGLKFIKCGHIPAKADNEQQHQWVDTKLKPAIEAARQGKVHLLFLDAAHFMLAAFYLLFVVCLQAFYQSCQW